MKLFTKKDKRSKLEKEIDVVLDELHRVPSDQPEYTIIADNLEKLYKIKNDEKSQKVKPDTYVNAIVYLGGIILVLWHEKTQIITGKAFSMLTKWRV